MTEKVQRPLLERIGKEFSALGGDLRESVVLRWQLAMLEIKADLRSSGRLAIFLVTATVMGLVALPLLLAALAHGLAHWLGWPTGVWLLIFGLFLAIAGPTVGFLTWRRFRRRWIGLEQTLEELHEDTLWLQEWFERSE